MDNLVVAGKNVSRAVIRNLIVVFVVVSLAPHNLSFQTGE